MANEEHLARLQQGVETWNQWRSDSTSDLQRTSPGRTSAGRTSARAHIGQSDDTSGKCRT